MADPGVGLVLLQASVYSVAAILGEYNHCAEENGEC